MTMSLMKISEVAESIQDKDKASSLLGIGIISRTGEQRDSAFKTITKGPTGQTKQVFKITTVESLNDLFKQLGIAASVSAGLFGGHLSARMSFAESTHISQYSVWALAQAVINSNSEIITDRTLSEEAERKKADLASFIDR